MRFALGAVGYVESMPPSNQIIQHKKQNWKNGMPSHVINNIFVICTFLCEFFWLVSNFCKSQCSRQIKSFNGFFKFRTDKTGAYLHVIEHDFNVVKDESCK